MCKVSYKKVRYILLNGNWIYFPGRLRQSDKALGDAAIGGYRQVRTIQSGAWGLLDSEEQAPNGKQWPGGSYWGLRKPAQSTD